MKKKRITKVSSRILMALLAVAMIFSFAASTLGTTVAADTSVFKRNDGIYTDYKSYLDGSVVQKLPSTVGDNETISVIVKLDTPTLLETYNETDKTMSFAEYVNTEEAQKVKAEILAGIVRDVYPKIESGDVKPTIYKVLPITEAEAAHDILYRGENVGKVVLTVK